MYVQTFERTGLRLGQFHSKEWALKERPYQVVARGLGRRDKPGQEGEWIEDPETRGILTGLHYWRADRQKRPVDGWQYAWPIITTPAGGTVATGSGKRCAVGLKQSALPIFDESLAPDVRFQPFGNTANRVPIGTLGIMLMGTNEEAQENLPIWADRRLAAPNRFGAAELGTPVHDLDSGGSYGVMARLQSAWYVAQPRGGKPKYKTNVLAWQMGPIGCGNDDGWGMVFGLPGPPLPGGKVGKPGARVLSVSAEAHGGPVDLGDASDKHVISKDADGNPITSVHWSTNTLFRGHGGDASLEFQKVPYVPPLQFPFLTRVHLRYDPRAQHDWFGEKKPGLWRWEAEVPFYQPTPCRPVPAGRDGTDTPPGYVPLPDLRDGPGVSVTGEQVMIPREASPSGVVKPYNGGEGYQPINATTMETAFPSLVFRPQAVTTEYQDYRHRIGISAEEQCAIDKLTPAVGRLESFGYEGGYTVTVDLTPGEGLVE